MDVRVNEAGADNLARHVVFHNAVVVSQTYDQPIGAGDVAGGQFVGKTLTNVAFFRTRSAFFRPDAASITFCFFSSFL